jgi:hypothetical protein
MSNCERCQLTGVFLVMILVFCVPQVLAGPHDHADGFFLRLSGGGGFASSSVNVPPGYLFNSSEQELTFDGGSGDLNLAIGAVVSPNLAVHGTIWGWFLSNPDVSFGRLSGSISADLNLNAFGGGLTYYFMPANIYLSGSIGGGVLSINDNNLSGESDLGIVVDLTLGKEWWVGDKWALGVALGGGFYSIPDGDIDENWTGGSLAIRFSATMN